MSYKSYKNRLAAINRIKSIALVAFFCLSIGILCHTISSVQWHYDTAPHKFFLTHHTQYKKPPLTENM